MAMGSQTLTIRGSSKSMNGKMFERLVLGTLLSIMDFEFLRESPDRINSKKKYFWLSNIDENERETDATVTYNKKAVSIDIGFIGRGNPEITLDKVTRFGAYKRIGGIDHDMTTIIIVDTVADNSDLINKAKRVNGHVLQMKKNTWVLEFAKLICQIFDFQHPLQNVGLYEIEGYLKDRLIGINMKDFLT